MGKLTSTDKRKIKLHFLASKQAYKDAIQGAGSAIINTLLGTKKTVDDADEYLGAKIGEQKNKITNTARRYILRTLIGLSVVGYTGNKVSEYFVDKNEKNKQEKIEKQYAEHAKEEGFIATGDSFEQGGKRYDEFTYIVTAEDIEQAKKQNVHVATIISDKFDKQDLESGDKYQNTGYNNVYNEDDIDGKDLDVEVGDQVFFKAREIKKVEIKENSSLDDNTYWDSDEEYFSKNFKLKEEFIDGMEFRHDVGISFYRVKNGDNLTKIRQKLIKIPRFSYLADKEYGWEKNARKIESFNIEPSDLKKGMLIPIPMEKEKREVSLKQFRKYSLEALNEMKNNKHYGTAIQKLITSVGEKKVVNVMMAFARSETTEDWKTFSDNIGSVTYHRREDHLRAFSFSPYHILMEWNADGKTMGPGLKARTKLGLTEGQTYHPKNAGKLFLAYWIEKIGKDNLHKYFDLNSITKGKIGKKYNGSEKYGNKLYANYIYVQKH